MWRNPLHRLSQTQKHISLSSTITSPSINHSSTLSFTATINSQDMAVTGLKATKGIELLTWGTPNGHKASILLEELKEAYGKDYTFQPVNIGQNIQKEDWFTKLCPNGRIPVIVDHDNDDFAVMEGSAILAYLCRRFDTDHKFTFTDDKDLSTMEQWVAWQHGGLGPMQGQANHFLRMAKESEWEKKNYGVQRYVGETERLYGVLDIRLNGRDYLAGPGKGKYSCADVVNYSWVNVGAFAGVDISQWKNLHAWWERINARPAVKKGINVPSESKLVQEVYKQRVKDEPEFQKSEAEAYEHVANAKAAYNYKYASP